MGYHRRLSRTARWFRVTLLVVASTEPDNVERLVVVVMVAFTLCFTAETRQSLDLAIPNSLSQC